jgi:hypothetical protein
MTSKINRFLVAALFGLASLSAGCAARDVDVSQRGPIRGESNVESNSSTSSSQTEQNQNKKERSSSTSGGAYSGSGSASGSGSYSGSGTLREVHS